MAFRRGIAVAGQYWRVIPSGLIDANEIWRVAYNSSAGAYRLLDLRNRTGEIVPFGGSTAPAGTLLCYGQAISRTDYVGLFTVIGTTYGVGNGTTTFNVPDMRGMVPGGKANMGGSDRGNLFGGTTLGAALGAQSGSANTSQPDSAASVDFDAPDANVAAQFHVHSFTNSTVQPTIILNYIIRI